MTYQHDFTKIRGVATKLAPNSAHLGTFVDLDRPATGERRLAAAWRRCPETGRLVMRWSPAGLRPGWLGL